MATSVKLPLEVQKIAWTATSSSAWATGLTNGMFLKAGNTYLIIARFPTLSSSSYEGYPVALGYSMSSTYRPITSNGIAMWIVTPSSDVNNSALCTGYSASVTYSNTSYAGLWVIKLK